MMVSEKRATWYKLSKETAKREDNVLAMLEDLKEHVKEALKLKEEN